MEYENRKIINMTFYKKVGKEYKILFKVKPLTTAYFSIKEKIENPIIEKYYRHYYYKDN